MDNFTPFRTFGTMLDCSRNAVPNLHTLKKWVDLTASLGYNTLLLYTEDTSVRHQALAGILAAF